jgi:hypothetical protein
MTYRPTEQAFNFNTHFYEIAFEVVETDFWEHLFSRKSTKSKFYIRRVPKGYRGPSISEDILYEDLTRCSLGYNFFRVDYENRTSYWTVKYWDNSTEPERLLTNMMNKLKPSQDNVVFSTKDL